MRAGTTRVCPSTDKWVKAFELCDGLFGIFPWEVFFARSTRPERTEQNETERNGLYVGFGLGTNLPSGATGFLFLLGHMPQAQIGTSLMGLLRIFELVAGLPTGWAGLLTRI